MKKKIALLLAAVLGVSTITGCTPASNQNTGRNKDGKIEISVGNWPTENDPEYYEFITKQKEEFEAENPDIVIVPDNWLFSLDTFYSKAASGQLPTVYYSNFTEIEKIIDGGYYTDISGGLKRAGYEGKFSDAVLSIISNGDEIVSFPTDTYALGLAINIDLFKKAGLVDPDGTPKQPKDWDEVVEFGKKIKETTGKNGFIVPTMNNFGGWLFTPVAWGFGVNFMKSEGEQKYTATFDDDKMVQALQYISDLKWKHNIFGENALIDADEYFKQFALGNVGMIITAPDFPSKLEKYEMPLEKMGMVAIPSGPDKRVTLTGGYTATVSNGATEEQVDAAIKWLEKVGSTYKVSDDFRKTKEEDYKLNNEQGRAIGLDGLSIYTDDTESRAITLELMEKYATLDKNAVRLYNESIHDNSIEYRPEEPVCTQELYSMLDGLIQEVLTKKDADIPALVKKANQDFQSNYLNK